MKEALRTLFGLNAAAVLRLFDGGFITSTRAAREAFAAARMAASPGLHRIPEIALGEILGDRKPTIRMTVTHHQDGMLPTEQALALLAILVAEQPREVLEIGTFMGHTTLQMALNLPASAVHTVDLPIDFSPDRDSETTLAKDDFHLIAKRRVGCEFEDRPEASRIVQHFTDTAAWDFSKAGTPSFFFIDGSHTYDYCRSDSEKSLAVAAPGAVFLWHDCDVRHPGVVEFLLEWRHAGRNVKRILGTPLAYWKRPG